MAYMLLIVEPQGQRGTRALPDGEDLYRRMLEYTESLRARGVLLASDSLRAPASRLSIRAGQQRVTDGPFTESTELVGGFFLLDCATRARRRSNTRPSAPRRSGPASRCARPVPVTNEPPRSPRSQLRRPGAAPPGGLHVPAGKELTGSARGAIRSLVQRAVGAPVSGACAGCIFRILDVFDGPGLRRIDRQQRWSGEGSACNHGQARDCHQESAHQPATQAGDLFAHTGSDGARRCARRAS